MQSHEENASSMTRDRFLSSSSLRANAEKIGISTIISGSQAEQRQDRHAHGDRGISRLGNAGLEAAQQHAPYRQDRCQTPWKKWLKKTGRAHSADRRNDKLGGCMRHKIEHLADAGELPLIVHTGDAAKTRRRSVPPPQVAAAAAHDARVMSMQVEVAQKKLQV